MRRMPVGPVRPAWEAANAAAGLTYNDTELPDGRRVSYWVEGPHYELTMHDVQTLEAAAETLFRMCTEVGDDMIATCPRSHRDVRSQHYLSKICSLPDSGCWLTRLGIPEYAHEQIIRTWNDDSSDTWTHRDKDLDGAYPTQTPDFSPGVYGRFDLRYDGSGPPKLLEFNAQTPTSLVESAIIQWLWQEHTGVATHPERQWNAIHEAFVGFEGGDGVPPYIGAWRRNIDKLRAARPWLPENPTIYFAYDTAETSGEDRMNTAYLADTAEQAGFPVELIAMSQIVWDTADDRIRFRRDPSDVNGKNDKPIDVIFMLYPWEWLWDEEGGPAIHRDMADPTKRGTVWIEPPYTAALWSNKALLVALWDKYKNTPESQYLLPAYWASKRPAHLTSYVTKPVWGREGKGVRITAADGTLLGVGSPVSGEKTGVEDVVQAFAPLPRYETSEGGHAHPVLGVWLVDGAPVGLGIRESEGLITTDQSHFIPHIITN